MPWVLRGLRDGRLTTRWPHRQDDYFDAFPSAVTVRTDQASPARADDLAQVVSRCPTTAISVQDNRAVLDQGRCILCGRCVDAAPQLFAWQHGSGVGAVNRTALIVGAADESDDAVDSVRASLAQRVKALRRSVHIRHVDAGSDGSDEWEVQALTNPVYDLHRLGIFFTASPRHADILLVTGVGAAEMVEPLTRTRRAMPDPVVVIAAGVDAVSGGLVGRGYASNNGLADIIDVDVWVPGSPASPFALLHAILLALGRIDERRPPARPGRAV